MLDLDRRVLGVDHLVGQEVVLEALDENTRKIGVDRLGPPARLKGCLFDGVGQVGRLVAAMPPTLDVAAE